MTAEREPGATATASRPSDAVAAVVDVSKRFGATRALEAVTLAVEPNESRALVGRNGAGKSTLVSLLTGLERPDAGAITFDGEPAPRLSDRDGWRRRVACVYQRSTLLPDLTVAENLFLNAHPRGPLGTVNWRALRARAAEVLDEWEVDVAPSMDAARLRVEDRQRVEIARALALGSRFLILDEPTARLEGPAIRRLFDHIERLRSAGVAILYISHHLDEIYEVCDSVTVLRDGRHVRTGAVAELPRAELVEAMVGDQATARVPRSAERRRTRDRPAAADAPTLRVDGLTVRGWYSQVSFGVRRGELVGLAGLAGSGKLQVAETIAGLRRADAGTVAVGGENVRPGDVLAAITRGIGYVPQDRHAAGFVPDLGVDENITLTLLGRLARFGIVRPAARRRLAARTMSSLDVVASGPSQKVSELSGGNQQKVVVGRALVTAPRVLVVVSPTAGVDVAAKETLFETLTSASELAVLVVSDELDELSHCDRVLVMFDGRVTTEFERWNERELVAAMEGVSET